MSPAAPSTPPPPVFRHWLRREFLRELRRSAVLLVAALAIVFAADKFSPAFAPAWNRLNYQLTTVALEQHPAALREAFAERLSQTQYGWKLFAWTEPFNVTAARQRLRTDFPDFAGLDAQGKPIPVRSSSRHQADPAQQQARADAYRERYTAIESHRFAGLYPEDSPFEVPSATVRLGRLVTKILGAPDAALHLFRRTHQAGNVSFLLFCLTFAIAAAALWTSQRPARHWLKLLLCPFLASTLAWVVILFMSIGAALFGTFTPNTSAVAIFAGIPLIYLTAKIPLRVLEELQLKPKPWDGVERRRGPRAPVA